MIDDFGVTDIVIYGVNVASDMHCDLCDSIRHIVILQKQRTGGDAPGRL